MPTMTCVNPETTHRCWNIHIQNNLKCTFKICKILNFFLGSLSHLEGFGFHYRTEYNGLIAYILHVSWLCFVYLLDWIYLPILNFPPFPLTVWFFVSFSGIPLKGLRLTLHFLELFRGRYSGTPLVYSQYWVCVALRNFFALCLQSRYVSERIALGYWWEVCYTDLFLRVDGVSVWVVEWRGTAERRKKYSERWEQYGWEAWEVTVGIL